MQAPSPGPWPPNAQARWAKRLFRLLLGARLPRWSGQLRVAARQPLTLRRDGHGVAYIDARNPADAWFGLGFGHGQDRAGQLELLGRTVRGTLSELAGPETLSIDRAVRLIGIRRAAEAQLEHFDADLREQIAAYVAGLNAALASGPRSHEHALLRIDPTPWQPADVIGLGLLTCCLLPSNWDVEAARLNLLERDGEAAVRALDPTYPAQLPLTSPPGAASGPFLSDYLLRDLQALRELLGTSGGSNAWALAGSKTATGRPLLANDPHLPAALPNLGYLARVKCPEFGVAGVSLVGLPVFLTGHNGHAAWGATSAAVDNVDLFLEELSADGEQVREGDRFVPCSAHTEWIPIRGRAPEALRVRHTARGPIVASAAEREAALFHPLPLLGRANALSMAATWLAARPTRAALGFHLLRSFEDFRACCAPSTACCYSLVYADPESVGWLLACEVPRRKSGHGSLPLPGWSPQVGWQEPPALSSELPWLQNPESGFVCCANNQPVADGESAVFLGHDFLDGYRQARITERLSAERDWSVASTSQLQIDVLSIAFRELRSTLLELPALDADGARALELLRGWNGELSGDSSGASVYALFLGELCQRICRVKAPASWSIAAGGGVTRLSPGTCWNARRASFVARLIVEQPQGYFASWPQEMAEVLSATVRWLRRDFGADERRWAWGEIRPLPLRHLLGQHPVLGPIFNRGPLPGYGDGTTVNQAGFEFWQPLRHSTVSAHVRSVMDVGNWSASRFVLLGGQSGNPCSPHYDDLVPLWQRGEGVPIHWEDSAITAHAVHILQLTPSAAR
ncbi:MAG TPA: penicillin acylase family protein [Polyangiaceae bacterium]|nr:penicillin acylase family protein [Polyangiaceae bacterium]